MLMNNLHDLILTISNVYELDKSIYLQYEKMTIKYLNKLSDNDYTVIQKLIIYMYHEYHNNAINLLIKYITMYPNTDMILMVMRLSYFYREWSIFKLCHNLLKKKITLDPDNKYILLGLYYFHNQQYEKGIKKIKKASGFTNKNITELKELYLWQKEHGYPDESIVSPIKEMKIFLDEYLELHKNREYYEEYLECNEKIKKITIDHLVSDDIKTYTPIGSSYSVCHTCKKEMDNEYIGRYLCKETLIIICNECCKQCL